MSSTPTTNHKQKGHLYLASSLCDGLEDNDLKQVKTLLRSKEADPNVLMPLHGVTPFHLVIGNDSEAFAEEVTKLFLRHGGNPNVKSVDGMTPVHVAAAWGRATILELLLANGGDPLSVDCDQCSPFHYAFQGEHYEAVQILSKYCINQGEDDQELRYKRELDRVLINNGEVIAEYTLWNDLSLSSRSQDQCIAEDLGTSSSNNYESSNQSIAPISIHNEFVTLRRNHMRSDAREKLNRFSKHNHTDVFDFKRETMEEEIRLINEIISQLSSSIASDVDNTNYCPSLYTMESSPEQPTENSRKIQMKMIFNRQKHSSKNYSTPAGLDFSKGNSTLRVIKKHNNVSQLNSDKMINKHKKHGSVSNENASPEQDYSFPRNNTSKSHTELKCQFPHDDSLLNLKNWRDETIISKSPNLELKTNSNNNRHIKNSNFCKKATSVHMGLSKKYPLVSKSNCLPKGSNKFANVCAPLSRIPRPKKFFTSSNSKSIKRTMNASAATDIPCKRKSSLLSEEIISECCNRTLFQQLRDNHTSCVSSHQLSHEDKSSNITEEIKISRSIFTDSQKTCSENDISLQPKTSRLRSSLHNWIGSTKSNCSSLDRTSTQCFSGLDMTSGVGRLQSRSAIKCKTESCNFDGIEGDISSPKVSVNTDMNQAILGTLTHNELKLLSQFDETLDFQKNSNSMTVNNSMFCEKTGASYDSSDVLRSTSKVDFHKSVDDDNEIEVKSKISSSPESDIISKTSNSSTRTFFSIEEEYKYEDADEGIALLERRLCVSPSCASTDLNSSFYSCSTAASEPLPKELFLLDNASLRDKLKNLGDNPGPIISTTYHVYLKRLHRLEKQKKNPLCLANRSKESCTSTNKEKDLLTPFLLSVEWIKGLSDLEVMEQRVFQEFVNPDPSRKWREGSSKMSFNYLLLDPRVTRNLPRRAINLSLAEKWETFLSAIFYVGKGKKSRPYEHLYDAFKIWVSQDQHNNHSSKIQKILDIWNEGKGVIVLHVFHNTIPVEAYTREAAMIDVLGTKKLGNCKCGDYYGVVATWRMKEKRDLGRYLLYKAMQILLIEGERQIFPDNL
ncbi:hypothetical protein QAD02_022059 [Eretmocerus hayati]|uniref:Uncharacterized protein n=1 Tax=Eretmocerus hayati TaxID=131215 RepID=A0ACC2PWT3_9HYME|nr:hypothetical protein QAD02_022059 [Eretmocerus hayati]